MVERPLDEVLGRRRPGVDVVAATGRLDVGAVVAQPVVRPVGQPPQAVRRPGLVDLGRVVEHDVEPHLDVVGVGGGDERRQLPGGIVTGGVLAVDGPEGQRHVPPVAALLGIVLVDGQQLDDGDAERGQPGQLVDEPGERAGERAVAPHRHPPHVELVDDRRPGRTARRLRRPRRPGDGHRGRPGGVHAAAAGQPTVVTRREPHLGGPGIEQHLGRVEAGALALGDQAVDRAVGRPRRPSRRPLGAAVRCPARPRMRRSARGPRPTPAGRGHGPGSRRRSEPADQRVDGERGDGVPVEDVVTDLRAVLAPEAGAHVHRARAGGDPPDRRARRAPRSPAGRGLRRAPPGGRRRGAPTTTTHGRWWQT